MLLSFQGTLWQNHKPPPLKISLPSATSLYVFFIQLNIFKVLS